MTRPVHVLIAEDDDDDYAIFRDLLSETGATSGVTRVKDGEELMDFLRRRGAYAEPPALPWPLILLLDLRMPKKDGLEALKEIKADPRLRRIPVIVLTTSEHPGDVAKSYELGGNAYLKKPVGLDELRRVVGAFVAFWLKAAEYPPA